MSIQTAIFLAVIIGLYAALHLGAFYLLKRGFRWIADTIDRFCGLDTSRH